MAAPQAGQYYRMVTSNAFHAALVAAGVIRDGERYRRIVIDAQEGRPVMIHAERYGDERLLDVVRTMDGIEVRYGRPWEPQTGWGHTGPCAEGCTCVISGTSHGQDAPAP